jgi:hypothetical protein
MKLIYSDKISGSCNKCHGPFTGGFLSLDENGTVTGMLCKECRQTEEVETNKTVTLTVKKLQGSFMQFILKQDLYQVVTCKNLILKNDILTGEEVNRYIQNPNVAVTIRH